MRLNFFIRIFYFLFWYQININILTFFYFFFISFSFTITKCDQRMYRSKRNRIEIFKIRDSRGGGVTEKKNYEINGKSLKNYGMTHFPKFEHLTKHIYISVSISSTSDTLYNTQSMWLIFTIKWNTFLKEEIMLKNFFFFFLIRL